MTVLLREAVGDRLRYVRTTQRRTLREIARAARVSLGYLSEVERGQKEASSELLAAICEALDIPLAELLNKVATDVSALDTVEVSEVEEPAEPARVGEPAEPAPAGQASARAGGTFDGAQLVPGAIGAGFADLPASANGLSPALRTTISAPRMSTIVAA